MSNDSVLGGRFGIITGAASGIGRAASIHLAQMGAGVALVDLDSEGLEKTQSVISKETSSESMIFESDVTDVQAVSPIVDQVVSKFGTIDFLVNSAGILRRTAFVDIPIEEWDLMLSVNLRGPYLYCRAATSHMVGRGKGVIINVASLAGRSSSILGGAHYSTAKHALVGLSRHMARELSPMGLRVNAFCPGATLTPMVTDVTSAEEIKAIAATTPRRKWATPEEQAAVIGFLVSDAAINITGACIDSNGGSLMV